MNVCDISIQFFFVRACGNITSYVRLPKGNQHYQGKDKVTLNLQRPLQIYFPAR